jgi:hypothetical protein
MIEVEKELNLLNILFEIFTTDKLWYFQEATHRLLISNPLSLHDFKETGELFLCLA